ncbi:MULTISPECIES: hypothetical protein [unclassified Actinotalea]|uniref:hypothetical protein n=1 Tax=unclassified Actinotalea TaxID=2638618 RepID=UPI0015F66527|nr:MULTISPECIES: hypothetical protein [unclassified Actinotalea]
MGTRIVRAAGQVLLSCLVIAGFMTVVLDRGPWTRWLVPTVLIVGAVAAVTWFRERRARARTAT